MTAEAPLAAVRAELRPEFHQFAVGTGDVLTAAHQLSERRSGSGQATSSDTCVLFTLQAGTADVRLTVEVWAEAPAPLPAPTRRFTGALSADGELLQIVSMAPSPNDPALVLPGARDYSVAAYLTEVSRDYDDVFDLDVRTEHWLVRLW
ncbi:hypothetical protein ACFORO_44120 [Amycolatopsis halotolerans]|uniref:Uncharacterized protein n=1 Tax=Amycolatopsis halotolerans TaxID=330083 RepID=A0ABV7QZ70_9PSEU